jgi:hypothetical protein
MDGPELETPAPAASHATETEAAPSTTTKPQAENLPLLEDGSKSPPKGKVRHKPGESAIFGLVRHCTGNEWPSGIPTFLMSYFSYTLSFRRQLSTPY